VRRYGLLCGIFSLITLNSFAQNALPLTTTLDNAVPYLINRIPEGSKVLVLKFTAETLPLSNYLADEITTRLVNDSNFTVVDPGPAHINYVEAGEEVFGEPNTEWNKHSSK
jgi:hypothetical protein